MTFDQVRRTNTCWAGIPSITCKCQTTNRWSGLSYVHICSSCVITVLESTLQDAHLSAVMHSTRIWRLAFQTLHQTRRRAVCWYTYRTNRHRNSTLHARVHRRTKINCNANSRQPQQKLTKPLIERQSLCYLKAFPSPWSMRRKRR